MGKFFKTTIIIILAGCLLVVGLVFYQKERNNDWSIFHGEDNSQLHGFKQYPSSPVQSIEFGFGDINKWKGK